MRKSITFPFTLLLLATTLMAQVGAGAAPLAPLSGPTERVSIRTNGKEGNGDSFDADISADGCYIAFASVASNLVSGDDNGVSDIFVHDRCTNPGNPFTERVSIRTGGDEANFDSFAPAISDDGRIVVFHSYATNLVDGDFNGVTDVFFHNRDSDKTKLVSIVLPGNSANDLSQDADISADGRYVVFQSYADNLVADDTNGKADIFRYDRQDKVMLLVSLDSDEDQGNGESRHPTISADGERIAFESEADNLVSDDNRNHTDVFVRNMNNTTTERVSVSDGESEARGDSFDPHIAGNGKHVVFTSFASNLVSDDDNGFLDVFMRDTSTDSTKLISVASDETQANEESLEPTTTADGRLTAFQSRATNLVPGDPDNARDVFVRDENTGTTVRISISSSGVIGNASSRASVIAANGRYVVFESKATNLVPSDTNNDVDVFVHDLVEPVPPRPPATLTVDPVGATADSVFAFTGAHFDANQSYEIWINGTFISGANSTDGNGDLEFVIQTIGSTSSGAYFVTVVQGTINLTAGFYVDPHADPHPVGGSGPIIGLPGSVTPYDNLVYLPITLDG